MDILALAFVSSLTALTLATPLDPTDVAAAREGPDALAPDTQTHALRENADEEEDEEEEPVGNTDFEDDDADDSNDTFLKAVESKDGHVDSLMHVHRKGGEILVPCFGMWWPVGGGYPVYEYVDEYYGDYKKRRKARKRKRAKAKRKKS